MHISAPSKRRGGWGLVSLWEGEGGRAALWSTQPHYSVYRTAHPLHCSSNQPKLTGLIRSPQNRTELLYVFKRSCRWDLQNDQSRAPLLPFFNALHCQARWYDFSSEHHLSLAIQTDTRMTQTWGRDVLLRCFEQCDFPEAGLRGCLEMTCDCEGFVGSSVRKARVTWWIIPRNVNRFHYTGNG